MKLLLFFFFVDNVLSGIDLLAVPDFASGAMENWGLVSFREDRIMFDEKIASILQKQQLAETMAHEIAHFCKFNSSIINLKKSQSFDRVW
jgi:aminopeptidase N